MRTRLLTGTVAAAGSLAFLAAAPAHAQSEAVQRAALEIYRDYVPDGRIDPCRHSSHDLKLAKDNLPPDIEQYAADYPAAIKAALEARARGDCDLTKPAAAAPPVTAPTAAPTPIPTEVPTKTVVPDPPEPESGAAAGAATPVPAEPDAALERVAAATPANEAPAPLVGLAILAGLLAVAGLLLLGLRRFGIAEQRLASAAHAWREARWRAAGTWEDFRDWVRLGR